MTTTLDEEVISKHENLGLAEIQEVIFPLLQKMCWIGDLRVNQIRKGNLTQTQIQGVLFSFTPFSLPQVSLYKYLVICRYNFWLFFFKEANVWRQVDSFPVRSTTSQITAGSFVPDFQLALTKKGNTA